MRQLKVRQFSAKDDPDWPNHCSRSDNRHQIEPRFPAIEPIKQARPCAGSDACSACDWRMGGASMRHFWRMLYLCSAHEATDQSMEIRWSLQRNLQSCFQRPEAGHNSSIAAADARARILAGLKHLDRQSQPNRCARSVASTPFSLRRHVEMLLFGVGELARQPRARSRSAPACCEVAWSPLSSCPRTR
jgi:hypothetical protein